MNDMGEHSRLRTDDRVEAARKPLREATHLPSYVYTSEEIFEFEKEKIFKKDWLAVARVEEIENPGDYMTFDIVGEPIIVARNASGALNAYYNVCVHRGTEIASGSGNAAQFKCPYHAWTYDLSGKLIGAAYMDDVKDFSLDDCRLPGVRLDVWEGWIFVNFDASAEPLSRFVADFAESFGVFQQGKMRVNRRLETTLNCNWKLVNENFVDIYHILTLHADTLVNWQGPEDYEYRAFAHGGYATFYENEMPTLDALRELGPAPWLSDWLKDKNADIAAGAGFLTPNFTTFVRPFSVAQIIVWPLTPTTTKIYQYATAPTLFFEDERIGERIKPIEDLMEVILEEDRPMIESLQRVMSKDAFVPGRMSSGEMLVHHYINDYLDRMFEDRSAA